MARKKDLNEMDIISKELETLKKQTKLLDKDKEAIERYKNKKKTIIISIVAAVSILVIAVLGAFIYVNLQSPISYGPNATAEEKTEKVTEEHEEFLKKIDKKSETVKEGVYFLGTYAYFDDDKNLVVDGYMRNFTGHEIYDLKGNITIKTPNDENIAGAWFEFTEKSFGSLKNGKSRPWRIIFKNDYVNVDITDLSKFTVTTEFEFYQK